jgi:anti-sigma factor RsiW
MKERLLRDLHAYHDGELRGPRRWWTERRLARDPAARAELARLAQLGAAMRDEAGASPAPDLWSRIVMDLPPAAAPAAEPHAAQGGFTLPKWAGALVAAGAVAYALLVVGPTPSIRPLASQPEVAGSKVLLLDTGRRPAFILQDDREATIIWLLPKQNADAGRKTHGTG